MIEKRTKINKEKPGLVHFIRFYKVLGPLALTLISIIPNIRYRVANSLLSQELKLCFSDTKCTKAPYTKKILGFYRY